METGRTICNTLKDVRLAVARANGIPYSPRECTHEGPCEGTCPACEAELRMLEAELVRRKAAGQPVDLSVVVDLPDLHNGCSQWLEPLEGKRKRGSGEEVLRGKYIIRPPVTGRFPDPETERKWNEEAFEELAGDLPDIVDSGEDTPVDGSEDDKS